MTREIYTFQSKYKAYQVYLRFNKYRSNNRTCIELREAQNHEPILA